ncbi:hypothetical protein SPHINGOT1_70156 [Sphingomonas sp. T1]|nr:hypothetical protein SPHINGOT1_70156 [Sphingomonas sp. T1]
MPVHQWALFLPRKSIDPTRALLSELPVERWRSAEPAESVIQRAEAAQLDVVDRDLGDQFANRFLEQFEICGRENGAGAHWFGRHAHLLHGECVSPFTNSSNRGGDDIIKPEVCGVWKRERANGRVVLSLGVARTLSLCNYRDKDGEAEWPSVNYWQGMRSGGCGAVPD